MKKPFTTARMLGLLALLSSAHLVAAPVKTPPVAGPHGWLGSETLKTRVGSFEFKEWLPRGRFRPAAARPAQTQSRR